jgi:hypothetical protein
VRPVDLGEFAGPRPAPAGPGAQELQPAAQEALARPGAALLAAGTQGPAGDEPGGDDVAAAAASPEAPAEDEAPRWEFLSRARPGQPAIVDSLVGEVNGRPIFADEVLEPIADQLIATAREHTGARRDAEFRLIVAGWLQQVITNELLLAEAESSLTTQQRQGLLAFLDSIKEETIRTQGTGSRGLAERRVRAEGAGGLDDYVQRQKELVLISEMRRRKIDPLVIVSWRDIEREYQRLYAEYNRPAAVTLARIRLPGDSPSRIEEVRTRLAAGEPFARVAESLGFRDGGRWETFPLSEGRLADIEAAPEIRTALTGLEEGQTAGPISMGGNVLWIHVASLERPTARSIYDPEVQTALIARVTQQRRKEAWDRYVNSLVQKGIGEELDRVAERVYAIARARYGS